MKVATDNFLNNLIDKCDFGIATFRLSDLSISFQNKQFEEWFPLQTGEGSTIQDRLAGLNIDRLNKRIKSRGTFSYELEKKIDKKSKIFLIKFSILSEDELIVQVVDYTKEKSDEYMLDSYVKMAESNKKMLEKSLDKIKEQKEELEVAYSQLEKERNAIELRALQAVINPHFVSNCLGSIQRFIVDNDMELSVNYVSYFGRLMRLNFEQSYSDYVYLSDIIQILETYVEIEKIRIEHDWQFNLILDPLIEIENTKIPPLLIQPFVENAIWHGINKRPVGGIITVEFILMDDEQMQCIIEDNGLGRNHSSNTEIHRNRLHSLNVTNKRLDILWEGSNINDSIKYVDLKNQHGDSTGTRVELLIPLNI